MNEAHLVNHLNSADTEKCVGNLTNPAEQHHHPCDVYISTVISLSQDMVLKKNKLIMNRGTSFMSYMISIATNSNV